MFLNKTKNILIFNTSDTGGAGTTIYRMFLGLKELGYNAKLVVNIKTREDDEVIQFQKKENINILNRFIKKVFNYERSNSHQHKFNTIFDYYFFDHHENEFDNALEGFELPIDFKPDIIIGAWVGFFLNFESIGKLSLKYNAKPYLLMNDIGLLTGGCHYNWKCDGYLKECNNCPAIIDIKFQNQARKNLLEKKRSIKKYNIKIIAGSNLTKIQSLNSILFKWQKEIQVFNGLIDFEIFNSLKRNIAKDIFDIKNDAKLIFCGALNFKEKRKGYKELKDALVSLSVMKLALKTKIFVLVVGNIPEELIIPKLDFKFISLINDPLLFSLAYQAADVFVSPSIEDCGPMMVVESLACGTPVVGFDIGFVSSLISNGENGFKIKNFNTFSMSEKIAEILSSKSDYFVANCIKSVKDKFSLNSLNELVEKL